MSSLFPRLFNKQNKDSPRLCREFSFNEFQDIYGTFRYHFSKRLREPCAENNNLINYDLKCKDFLNVNGGVFMIFGGIAAFTLKSRFGHKIDYQLVNYLGEKKSHFA
jgi:hypothetical protein